MQTYPPNVTGLLQPLAPPSPRSLPPPSTLHLAFTSLHHLYTLLPLSSFSPPLARSQLDSLCFFVSRLPENLLTYLGGCFSSLAFTFQGYPETESYPRVTLLFCVCFALRMCASAELFR